MTKTYILIVDDAKDILFLLTHSVKRLGPDYEVYTATNAPEALEQIQQRQFDLVITDYMMDGMTGLDMAQEVRRLSPKTQIVLMSAYDTQNLRDTVRDMGLSDYIGKPFTVKQVLDVVQEALAKTDASELSLPVQMPTDERIYEALKLLYAKTGAHYVVLTNAQGQPVRAVGNVRAATLARLATFVSTNFLAVTELASLMGDNTSVFKSSYYEGSNYNLYAYNINSEYFLAAVFDARDKPGAVWFYTKQTATTLAILLAQDSSTQAVVDVEATLVTEFNSLLGKNVNRP